MSVARAHQACRRVLRIPATADWVSYALLGVIVSLAVVHSRTYAGVVIDDAFITFRHAWNLIHGRGFTCNPGERVEGTSSPLFALLMAVPIGLGIAPETAAVWLSVSALAACVVVAYLMVRATLPEPASRLLGLGAAGLVASSSTLAFHSRTGLETVPYACLLAIGVWLRLRAWKAGGTSVRWAVVMGLAALMRPEGFVFFFCLLGLAVVSRIGKPGAARLAAREFVAFACVWGPWLLFRLLYFGRWLPNSVLAKSGHLGETIHSLSDVLPLMSNGPGTQMTLRYLGSHVLGTVALVGAALLRPVWYPVGIAFTVTLGYAAVATWNGGDWMPHDRLLVPCIVLLAVASALGLRGFLFHQEQQYRGNLPSIVIAVLVFTFMVAPTHRLSTEDEKLTVKDLARLREMGRRLASVARQDDRVTSNMAGILPYYWHAPTVDIYGLCDAHIAEHGKLMPIGIGRFDPSYVIAMQPTFYVFEFSFVAAEFYQLPEFASERDKYYMTQYPYGYLGSTGFNPPVLLARKDRPDVESVAKALGARWEDLGAELRRIGFFREKGL